MRRDNSFSDKKGDIIKKYNSSSFYYEKRYRDIQLYKFKTFLRRDSLRKKIILDAGCGTGLLMDQIFHIDDLSDQLKSNYVGIDISLNMLNILKLKLNESDKVKLINLILADLESLPFRKNIFDCVFSITVFQNLVNLENGVENLIRVGKNKSEITISILKKKLNMKEFEELVVNKIYDYQIYNNPKIEDFFIIGKINDNEE